MEKDGIHNMFRDKSVLVKVVKDPDAFEVVDPIDVEAVTATVAKYSILVIASYFGGATLRDVLVHIAKTGIRAE
jgi:hypothetical protein